MKIEEQVKYWLDLAESDIPVVDSLFEKNHYMWSLFVGHLILEKMLKAFFTRDTKETPPKTHNLVHIAKLTKLNLTREQEEFLIDVSTFNIEARYPDYKKSFYKKCTKEFTKENINRIKEFYKWLKSQI
jgi:HEPN domain-containing protein